MVVEKQQKVASLAQCVYQSGHQVAEGQSSPSEKPKKTLETFDIKKQEADITSLVLCQWNFPNIKLESYNYPSK